MRSEYGWAPPPPPMPDAACAGHVPDLWHPTSLGDPNIPAALRVCGDCPERDPCLLYGSTHDLDGIWGGVVLHPKPRKRHRRKQPVNYQPDRFDTLEEAEECTGPVPEPFRDFLEFVLMLSTDNPARIELQRVCQDIVHGITATTYPPPKVLDDLRAKVSRLTGRRPGDGTVWRAEVLALIEEADNA